MKFEFVGQNMPNFVVETESEQDAIELANAYYGSLGGDFLNHVGFDDGRWSLRDEGEDSDCNITYVLFERQTPIYVVHLNAGDASRNVGAFYSRGSAQKKIQEIIEDDKREYPAYCFRHQQNQTRYAIECHFIEE